MERIIEDIIRTKRFNEDDLLIIFRKWNHFFFNSFPSSYTNASNVHDRIKEILRILQVRSLEEGDKIYLDALRLMIIHGKFSAVELNRFLQENYTGYKYEYDTPYSTQGKFVKIRLAKPDQHEPAQYSKVFISHSSVDVEYVEALVEFLELIGVPGDRIFCSSVPEYGIPLDEDIYEYIKKQFTEERVYVLFVLSDAYYKSAACLNEMGAAWVLQASYTSVLLPSFEFKEMRGAVKANKISIKTDDKEDEVHTRLIQLRNKLQAGFGLEPVNEAKWSRRIKLIEERLRKPRG